MVTRVRFACALAACIISVSAAVSGALTQQLSSLALMARCGRLYDLWWRYDEDPVFFGLAEKSQVELALYNCQRGRHSEGIPVLEQLLRNGGFHLPNEGA
jgi:hypothetical protein